MADASARINGYVDDRHKKKMQPHSAECRNATGSIPSPSSDVASDVLGPNPVTLSILADLLSCPGEKPGIGAPPGQTIDAHEVVPADEFDDPLLYVPGSWHRGKALKGSLAWVGRTNPGLLPLARVLLPRLPCYPLCSDTLKTDKPSSKYEAMNRALRRQWLGMQARRQNHVNVLHQDCDGEDWRERLRCLVERGLPAPTFIVVSPVRWKTDEDGMPTAIGRGHETAHLLWLLSHPVKKANRVSFDLFTRIRQALAKELGADLNAAGHIGKNPFSPAYVTEVGPLEPVALKDLLAPMIAFCAEGEFWLGKRTVGRGGSTTDRPGRRIGSKRPVRDDEHPQWGRHFEARHEVYARNVRDHETILAMVQDHAVRSGSDARQSQIKATAKSIHAHMLKSNDRFCTRPGVRYGAMSREAAGGRCPGWQGLNTTEKQAASGRRSAEMRSMRTADAIRREVVRALRQGDVVTQASLAAAVGIGIRRIQDLWASPVTWSQGDIRSIQLLYTCGHARGRVQEGGDLSEAPSLKQLAAISRERAAAARAEAQAVMAYRALAKAMRRPGAEPQVIPPMLPDQRSRELRNAHRAAVEALRGCARRKEKRRKTVERKAHRAEKLTSFAEWAACRDIASMRRFMADEEVAWDARETQAEGWAPEGRRKLRQARGAAFKRHWAGSRPSTWWNLGYS